MEKECYWAAKIKFWLIKEFDRLISRNCRQRNQYWIKKVRRFLKNGRIVKRVDWLIY